MPEGLLSSPGARRALAGFFVCGVLFSFFGAVLPSWGHHLRSDYEIVGALFFCASAGIAAALRLSVWLLRRKGPRFVLVLGCGIATGSLLYLAAVCPPAPAWTRMIGMFIIGVGGGLLQAAIFQAISAIYQHDPVATANLGATLFGLGCITTALVFAGTFYIYTVPSILILLAIIPGLFTIAFAKVRYRPVTGELRRPIKEVLGDLRSPTAVLFAVLLFFQFGNEWAIAGWLPLFAVQRLGISPTKSLLLLAVYWLALVVGRIVIQSWLPRLRRGLVLVASLFTALFGCVALSLTDSRFGALIGVIFVGAGFSSIYPLVAEKIGHRFPDYHPGLYNGIFSIALTGAFLAPCTLGFLASFSGVQVVPLLPLFGSIMVLLLLAAIWVESRAEAQGIRTDPRPSGPS